MRLFYSQLNHISSERIVLTLKKFTLQENLGVEVVNGNFRQDQTTNC